MRRTRTPHARLGLAILVLLSTAACVRSAAQRRTDDLAASRPVTFASADGVRLAGRLFGHGSVGVVLSHMLPADQTSWWDFARELADRGYLALTYDFRGYCPGGDAGCSRGAKDVGAIPQDVLGAIDEIRSAGATRVVLIGASMGGTASLVAAARPGTDVTAIVTLSAPVSIEGLVASPGVLTNVTAAKLFIAGNGDPTGAADAAQRLYDTSPPPKRVDIVTSNDHGTDLLTGNQSGIVQTTILNDLEQYAAT
jgi:predicted alpha/beta-hydrolase family hydrolase